MPFVNIVATDEDRAAEDMRELVLATAGEAATAAARMNDVADMLVVGLGLIAVGERIVEAARAAALGRYIAVRP